MTAWKFALAWVSFCVLVDAALWWFLMMGLDPSAPLFINAAVVLWFVLQVYAALAIYLGHRRVDLEEKEYALRKTEGGAD